ncbi:MAG: hypothetical protein QNJ54_29650 [Prochloraceae cyanobacterium]|nr:hypothetical protein [Prochloraceae cyanobacterium]
MLTIPNTHRSDREKIRKPSPNNIDRIQNAVLAILKGVAVKVIRFIKKLGRGHCPWVHYETPEGKRRATFLSPKAFSGYSWNAKYSEVVNLETGAVYQVSDRSCTCQFWHWKVRTGKKRTCKHQDMRAEFEGKSLTKKIALQKETIHIDPNNPPAGCILRRTDDWMSAEYEVLVKSPNPSNDSPETKLLGRVVEQKDGIFAIAHQCKTGVMTWDIEEAIAYLLYSHGMNYKQFNEAEVDKTAIKELNHTKANELQETPIPNDGFGGFYSLAMNK